MMPGSGGSLGPHIPDAEAPGEPVVTLLEIIDADQVMTYWRMIKDTQKNTRILQNKYMS